MDNKKCDESSGEVTTQDRWSSSDKQVCFPFLNDDRRNEFLERNELGFQRKVISKLTEKDFHVLHFLDKGCFAYLFLCQINVRGFEGYYAVKIAKEHLGKHLSEEVFRRDALILPYHRNVVPVIPIYSKWGKRFGIEELSNRCDKKLLTLQEGSSVENDFFSRCSQDSGVILMKCYRYDLHSFLEKRRKAKIGLKLEEISRISFGVLSGICHLKKHNIVHRDLHEKNIFVDEEKGRVLIGDFGCHILVSDGNFIIPKKSIILRFPVSGQTAGVRSRDIKYSYDVRANVVCNCKAQIDHEKTETVILCPKCKKKFPPELVEAHEDDNVKHYNFSKTDLYSVGLIIEILLCFNGPPLGIDDDENLKKCHSDLVNLSKRLLSGLDDRPSYEEALRDMKKISKEIEELIYKNRDLGLEESFKEDPLESYFDDDDDEEEEDKKRTKTFIMSTFSGLVEKPKRLSKEKVMRLYDDEIPEYMSNLLSTIMFPSREEEESVSRKFYTGLICVLSREEFREIKGRRRFLHSFERERFVDRFKSYVDCSIFGNGCGEIDIRGHLLKENEYGRFRGILEKISREWKKVKLHEFLEMCKPKDKYTMELKLERPIEVRDFMVNVRIEHNTLESTGEKKSKLTEEEERNLLSMKESLKESFHSHKDDIVVYQGGKSSIDIIHRDFDLINPSLVTFLAQKGFEEVFYFVAVRKKERLLKDRKMVMNFIGESNRRNKDWRIEPKYIVQQKELQEEETKREQERKNVKLFTEKKVFIEVRNIKPEEHLFCDKRYGVKMSDFLSGVGGVEEEEEDEGEEGEEGEETRKKKKIMNIKIEIPQEDVYDFFVTNLKNGVNEKKKKIRFVIVGVKDCLTTSVIMKFLRSQKKKEGKIIGKVVQFSKVEDFLNQEKFRNN